MIGTSFTDTIYSLLKWSLIEEPTRVAQVHAENHLRELENGTMFWDLDSRRQHETMEQTFRVSIDSATTM